MLFSRLATFLGLALLLSGCSYFLPDPPCPPPPSARPPTTPTFSCTNPTVPPVIPESCEILALADLVDLGLQNSPTTRISWYQAKQAAADLGTARGAYVPTLNLEDRWEKNQFLLSSFGVEQLVRQSNLTATLSTTYLLLDFGGRNGTLMAARSALESLNWYYNWEVQTVMIQVIQSYYNYINALGVIAADEATVEDNRTTLEAAAARATTGVTSLSDQLQAETSLLQSEIVLEQDRGILNVAYATLIRALGLPPETCLSIAALPVEIETEAVCANMATLLQIAKDNRADLKGQRARVMERRFDIRTTRSALLPTVNSSASGSYNSINNLPFKKTYSIEFDVKVPLLNQFKNINDLRKAQAALLESQAILDDEELSAYLEVLSDYYELIANTQILKYSYKYLDVATKNREVAFANYKMGVTTIIDLMTANNALNIARVQLIDAKTNFLSSLANLAYHTGELTVDDFFGYFSDEDAIDEPCGP